MQYPREARQRSTGWPYKRTSERPAVYAQGHVQLTVGDDVILDQDIDGKAFSRPVNLASGKRRPIMLRYKPAEDKFAIHLNWESHNQQIEHVPQSALYPPERDATAR